MITTRIVNFIGGHEKYVSTWYLDPVHVPTLGYGFTWGSKVFREWWMAHHGRKMQKGDTISPAEAHEVLLLILRDEVQQPVDTAFRSVAGNRVLEAAYSATMNLGAGCLQWRWAAAIIRGDLRGGVCALAHHGHYGKRQAPPRACSASWRGSKHRRVRQVAGMGWRH